jgi:hypothetical protein
VFVLAFSTIVGGATAAGGLGAAEAVIVGLLALTLNMPKLGRLGRAAGFACLPVVRRHVGAIVLALSTTVGLISAEC